MKILNNSNFALLEERTFVSQKKVIELAYNTAIQKIKEINFKKDEDKKKFLISMIISISLERGIHFNNLRLISICKKIKNDYNVSFQEIYIINKNLRLNKIVNLTDNERKEIAFYSFLEKFIKGIVWTI